MAVVESNMKGAKPPVAVIVAALAMVLALALAQWLKPTRILADTLAPMALDTVIPTQFADWVEVPTSAPVVVDPSIEAAVKALYSSTLVRSYRNRAGDVIYLSVAYGKNQNSWSTAAHRPDFCYAAQGFEVERLGTVSTPLSQGRHVDTVRLVATQLGRVEPISYWVTLADTATLPGVGRKWQQFRYGLQGWIVDGLLMRVSSIGDRSPRAFEVQAQFLRDLDQALSADFQPRFFGRC